VRIIRFVVVAVVLVALLLFVAVPFVAGRVLEQRLRDLGLVADELSVSVDPLDPMLLLGHTRWLRVQATNVVVAPASVGQLDVTFGEVAFFDNSFGSVTGDASDIRLTAGGLALTVDSIHLNGPAAEVAATARLSTDEAASLIRQAARREGLPIDSVSLANGQLQLTSGTVSVGARVSVAGGALVLEPASGTSAVLLQPAPADPWRLSDAWIDSDELRLRGVFDAARLAQRVVNGGR
jgi:hypothetical protein